MFVLCSVYVLRLCFMSCRSLFHSLNFIHSFVHSPTCTHFRNKLIAIVLNAEHVTKIGVDNALTEARPRPDNTINYSCFVVDGTKVTLRLASLVTVPSQNSSKSRI